MLLFILQCNGSDILWSHILDLYHRDSGAQRESPGLAIAHKIKREHVYLTSFSKMRVDLAAQVNANIIAMHANINSYSIFICNILLTTGDERHSEQGVAADRWFWSARDS